ncbi:ATP-binding protein [Teichococcus aestuarii]|uniref:ATP-binding protein n=1 Tax=Teichococcus aestuarii TaxID=568898 RepID=UPI003617EF89
MLGDPGRFRQILFNLVGNAVKFTESGWILLEVEAVAMPAGRHEAGPCWRLSCGVLDTGIGLDPASIPTLFERFTQADASISRRYGGTGLGLAICRRLLEMMGGGISAAPRPGGGSAFRFHLEAGLAPALPAASGALRPRRPATPCPGSACWRWTGWRRSARSCSASSRRWAPCRWWWPMRRRRWRRCAGSASPWR